MSDAGDRLLQQAHDARDRAAQVRRLARALVRGETITNLDTYAVRVGGRSQFSLTHYPRLGCVAVSTSKSYNADLGIMREDEVGWLPG